MKTHSFAVVIMTLVGLLCSNLAFASTINGYAKFSALKTTYYIGALELAEAQTDAERILNSESAQRMVLSIQEEWSPRRFKTMWNDAIFLSNDHNLLLDNNDDVQAFLNLPKGFLLPGDELTVSFDGNGTGVSLNQTAVFKTNDKTLFQVILSTWIGAKPPNSQFKKQILGLSNSSDLKAEFDAISTSEERQMVTQFWYQKPEPPAPVEQTPVAAPVVSTQVPATKAKSAPVKPAPVATPKIEPKPLTAATPKPVALQPKPKVTTPKKPQAPLLKQYQALVQQAVLSAARYPRRNEIAREVDGLVSEMNPAGVVAFNLQLNRVGKLLDIQEVTVSDAEILNKFALKALQKAEFPVAPTALQGAIFQARVSLHFANRRVQ